MASGSCSSVFTKLSVSSSSQIVINTFYCQPCYVSPFSWLFSFGCFQFSPQVPCIRSQILLCFIKEYDSPVYFIETYLFRIAIFSLDLPIAVLLKGPSVPSSAASCHLKLRLLDNSSHLSTIPKKKLYQQILIKLIQLFFYYVIVIAELLSLY